MTTTTKKMIEKLAGMRLPDLQAKYAEVVGETTRSPNKVFLVRKITETLEAREAEAREAEAVRKIVPTEAARVDGSVAVLADADERLTKLDVPTLQKRYVEVVGRPTGSTNKDYLVWKIREAKKGRISIGPRVNASRPGVRYQVLPLRMASDAVALLDDAWPRLKLRSRMDLFRTAVITYLDKNLRGDEKAEALAALLREEIAPPQAEEVA